jgi:hypothetical protein
MNEEIKQIAEEEMQVLKMKDDEFRKYLNTSISPAGDTYIKSKTTILNMRLKGIPPRTDVLEDLLSVYPSSDRRFRVALRLLAAKSPHVWGADGVVWKLKALKLSKAE